MAAGCTISFVARWRSPGTQGSKPFHETLMLLSGNVRGYYRHTGRRDHVQSTTRFLSRQYSQRLSCQYWVVHLTTIPKHQDCGLCIPAVTATKQCAIAIVRWAKCTGGLASA